MARRSCLALASSMSTSFESRTLLSASLFSRRRAAFCVPSMSLLKQKCMQCRQEKAQKIFHNLAELRNPLCDIDVILLCSGLKLGLGWRKHEHMQREINHVRWHDATAHLAQAWLHALHAACRWRRAALCAQLQPKRHQCPSHAVPAHRRDGPAARVSCGLPTWVVLYLNSHVVRGTLLHRKLLHGILEPGLLLLHRQH